jgi:hypothetical protein
LTIKLAHSIHEPATFEKEKKLTITAEEELPRTYLTAAEVTEIKALLWEGTLTQSDLALRFTVSQPTISRILRGKEWDHIPWPDASNGQMPTDRYQVIQRSKHKAAYASQGRARLRQTEVSANAALDVQVAVDKALEKKDKALLDAIKHPGAPTGGETKGRAKTKSWDALPWDDVKLADPANPLVKEVESGEDDILRLATCITLFAIPQAEWSTQHTVALAHRIADRLRGEAIDN